MPALWFHRSVATHTEDSIQSPLHICMVVRSFCTSGGLELYTHKLVEGLLAAGHKVTILCHEAKSDLSHPGLNIAYYDPGPASLSKAEQISHQLASASQRLQGLGAVDIVHSQHFPVAGADVVTFHNHSVAHLSQVGFAWENLLNKTKAAMTPAYRLRNDVDRMLTMNANCLIFPAQVMRDDYFAAFPQIAHKQTPAVIAYPGASLSAPGTAEPPAGSKSDNEAVFRFLFVGKGFRKKGLDVLLDACQILVTRGCKFELLIAGLRKKPIDQLRLSWRGLNREVKFLGFCQDMASVYAQAQAVVIPSRLEPFGMAVVQAMQHGLVPIVTRVSGVAEVLHDRQDGLILDNHLSASDLADLMASLMANGPWQKELSSAARVTARTISWDNTVAQTIAAYKIVLAAKTKAKANLH